MSHTYKLELYPTEGNWDSYVTWFGGQVQIRTNDNAGVDLYCVKDTSIFDDNCVLLDLGVKARMFKVLSPGVEEPCHFWLAPRSSIWKSEVRQANSLGVIDLSYRGPLMGAVLRNSGLPWIKQGTRLFQVLAPDMGYIKEVHLKPLSELDETSRGDGGFGSTGK